MSYRTNALNQRIDRTVSKLKDTGIVPIDEIFGLVSEGVDFSTLDEKYNILN